MSPHATYSSQPLGEGLTPKQLAFWQENGYLIIPNALDQPTIDNLLATVKTMLEDFPLKDHPMTKFTTGESTDQAHVGDEYFLTSGDKIRFFFEEGAFSPSGTLQAPKSRSINKIGHSLHTLSPPFRALTLSAHTRAIARSLAYRDPQVLQSMVICKQAGIGAAVPAHQDSTFLYTDPPSAVGFWYALEDAGVENGCLSFAGGSQRRSPVKKRFVRMGGGTGFRELRDGEGRFASGLEIGDGGEEGGEEEKYTTGPVKAGSLVLIHGNLLHKSERNLSQKSRFIYTFHMIEGDGCVYDRENWLQPTEKGFTRLYDEMP